MPWDLLSDVSTATSPLSEKRIPSRIPRWYTVELAVGKMLVVVVLMMHRKAGNAKDVGGSGADGDGDETATFRPLEKRIRSRILGVCTERLAVGKMLVVVVFMVAW